MWLRLLHDTFRRGSGSWATLAPVSARHLSIRASRVPCLFAVDNLVRDEDAAVLVELGGVEQRYKAVLEVLNDGASVTDVARRYGVGARTLDVLDWRTLRCPPLESGEVLVAADVD
jgi:hypothetical protein